MFKEPAIPLSINVRSKKPQLSDQNVLEESGRKTLNKDVAEETGDTIAPTGTQLGDNVNVEKPSKQVLDSSSLPKNVSQSVHKVSLPDPPSYEVPSWGGFLNNAKDYYFEILKDGCIIGNVELKSKTCLMFGKLKDCDVVLEHPTISRRHAVVQCRSTLCSTPDTPCGLYLYDLGSTHGTMVNKQKITPRTYVHLRVGHMIKFGGSTRTFLLQGPEADTEDESELSVSELKRRSAKQRQILQGALDDFYEEGAVSKAGPDPEEKEVGVDWGLVEDAPPEPESETKSDSDSDEDKPKDLELEFGETAEERENFYRSDPKKALKGFFDREGFDMVFEFTESGTSHTHHWTCKIELPFDTPSGKPLVADATVGGSKRDAQVACALAACRLLDAYGVLRQSSHESRKRKSRDWEKNDYYSSDEDEFLDRTHELQKKREARKQRGTSNAPNKRAETYNGLLEKLRLVEQQMDTVQKELDSLGQVSVKMEAGDGQPKQARVADSLDVFMQSVSEQTEQKTEEKFRKRQLRAQLQQLELQATRLKKLANVAKPASLPALKTSDPMADARRRGLIGAIKSFKSGQSIKEIYSKAQAQDADATSNVKVGGETETEVEMEEDEDQPATVDAEKSSNVRTHDVASVLPSTTPVTYTAVDTRIVPSATPITHTAVNTRIGQQDSETPKRVSLPPGPLVTTVETNVAEEMVNDALPSPSKIYSLPQLPVNEQEAVEVVAADNVTEEQPDQPLVDNTKAEAAKRKRRQKQMQQEFRAADPKYAVWIPPENQSGDGRTSLNEKFGY